MYQIWAKAILLGVSNSCTGLPDNAGCLRSCRIPEAALCLVSVLLLAACSSSHAHETEPPSVPLPTGDAHEPDANDTGVPAGTDLIRSGSIDVHHDGTTIVARDVHGTIHVHANDVTIRDTRVTSSDYWPIWIDPGRHGLRVIDTEVVGSGSCQAGIAAHDYVAIRVNVHGCGNGAKAGQNTTIAYSWLHELRVMPGSHNNGIQVSGGDHIQILGNRITAPASQTAAIMIGPDYGRPIVDVTIVGNWLDGGDYALHLDAEDAVVRDNHFGSSALYGPANVVQPAAVWESNVLTDTGRAVPQ